MCGRWWCARGRGWRVARPEISVVMPFSGDAASARRALATLRSLRLAPGDELILADNSGTAPRTDAVRVVDAAAERSPAHARNAGAAAARGEWILFLDADCHPPVDLLEAYFAAEVDEDVGALAGEVVGSSDGGTLASRYGAARNFLGHRTHLAHRYLPRAVAANLMVRRAAFEALGGFYEGVRAAEDTDFSWRLQQAGWRLEPRPQARVEHVYRASLRELRRQWRGYAAGRAWLARRYDGFIPEPAMRRVLARGWPRAREPRSVAVPAAGPGRYRAIDALLAVEELAGLALSNKPARPEARPSAQVVLVAGRFPAPDDPRADYARRLSRARVEAAARPKIVDHSVTRLLPVDYREDEGVAARWRATVVLAGRHPLRVLRDVVAHGAGGPSLASLAPAALRLAAEPDAVVRALGGEEARAVAERLAALAGRKLDH